MNFYGIRVLLEYVLFFSEDVLMAKDTLRTISTETVFWFYELAVEVNLTVSERRSQCLWNNFNEVVMLQPSTTHHRSISSIWQCLLVVYIAEIS